MKRLLLFSIFIFTLSCDGYTEIKGSEKAFIMNSSPTFQGYYYNGSDNYFDYFESRWSFEKKLKFKIPKKNFLIIGRFDKNSSKDLKIDVFKTSKIFGVRNSDTLYISKTNEYSR